jgi:hypothetical protein
MRIATLILGALTVLAVSGCDDDSVVAPRDVTPPAAPRGLYSVTGDHSATLRWLANTEGDVVGYRIYMAPCASGTGCPYDRVGTTSATQFAVPGLANGVTRYFAVAAVDEAGNESELSYETVFDTPRPAGFGASVLNFVNSASGSGWDFSAALTRRYDDSATDVYFGHNGSVAQMFARDGLTDIQDAGYATTLDAVDWAPNAGWSPTGTVELIAGHCYVVWTRDDHYAKFRVTSVSTSGVTFDWAYQTDPGNPELHAGRVRDEAAGQPRPVAWIR